MLESTVHQVDKSNAEACEYVEQLTHKVTSYRADYTTYYNTHGKNKQSFA